MKNLFRTSVAETRQHSTTYPLQKSAADCRH